MYFHRAQEDKATHGPGRRFGEPDRCIDIHAVKLRVLCGAMGDRSQVDDGVDVADKAASIELRGDVGDKDLLGACGC